MGKENIWRRKIFGERKYLVQGIGSHFLGSLKGSQMKLFYRMNEIEWMWPKSKRLKKKAYQCSYCMQWIKGSPPIKYPSKIVRCEVIALFVEQR